MAIRIQDNFSGVIEKYSSRIIRQVVPQSIFGRVVHPLLDPDFRLSRLNDAPSIISTRLRRLILPVSILVVISACPSRRARRIRPDGILSTRIVIGVLGRAICILELPDVGVRRRASQRGGGQRAWD